MIIEVRMVFYCEHNNNKKIKKSLNNIFFF